MIMKKYHEHCQGLIILVGNILICAFLVYFFAFLAFMTHAQISSCMPVRLIHLSGVFSIKREISV